MINQINEWIVMEEQDDHDDGESPQDTTDKTDPSQKSLETSPNKA